MLESGTDPVLYITEYTLVYEGCSNGYNRCSDGYNRRL